MLLFLSDVIKCIVRRLIQLLSTIKLMAAHCEPSVNYIIPLTVIKVIQFLHPVARTTRERLEYSPCYAQ